MEIHLYGLFNLRKIWETSATLHSSPERINNSVQYAITAKFIKAKKFSIVNGKS